MPIRTLTELFLVAAEYDKPDCLQHKVQGGFQPISTAELVDRVRRLVTVLDGVGVERGDRVALMADNGPHWPTIDFATLCLGGVLVPIYPTLTPDQAAFIVNDCGAKVIFIQGSERFDQMLTEQRTMPDLEHLILIDGEPPEDGTAQFSELLQQAVPRSEGIFRDEALRAAPDELATFIYTSGTTGNPKGVMLTHQNIASNVVNGLKRIPVETDWTALSFLPLSHSLERTIDYIYFHQGVSIAYAESVQAVGQNLQEVRPHLFVSVPRVYETILAKVQENVAASTPAKRKIFHWAEGIEIYEGYGLSETSPILTANGPRQIRMGAVGRPIADTELSIADDGEILARGPQVMHGYFNMPEATAEAIDSQGWFHTGDIGEIDSDGFLRITDRKKEIIVNAYGKNVAPAPIENALKSSPFIGQAVVIGDRRKFLSALLVPDFDALTPWARRQGLADEDLELLIGSPPVKELVKAEVERINLGLARYEQVRTWELLVEDFTIETGELTPTQKIKRRVIIRKFGHLVEEMYERAEKSQSEGRR